jgi:hypothetical protein
MRVTGNCRHRGRWQTKRRPLADVIASASDGQLSLDGLTDLMNAEGPLLCATTSRMS